MWGKRRLISHKFEGTGQGGAGMYTEGWPRSCARVHGAAGCEPGVQLVDAQWARLAAGRVHNGCELGMQLAVARWARLSARRVHYGCAAGGCPMGQAGSWAGAQWACSWRLPDGPGCQLGGCTMGVQLAVAWWARLSEGRVHYGRAAGGCPMGQAGSWAGALWACSWRLGVPWVSRCATEDARRTWVPARSISQTKFMIKASDVAQIIHIQISYKHSVIYAHIQGIICHMIYL